MHRHDRFAMLSKIFEPFCHYHPEEAVIRIYTKRHHFRIPLFSAETKTNDHLNTPRANILFYSALKQRRSMTACSVPRTPTRQIEHSLRRLRRQYIKCFAHNIIRIASYYGNLIGFPSSYKLRLTKFGVISDSKMTIQKC